MTAKTSAGLLVLLALLACKKDKTEETPPATTETAPVAAPEAAPSPEPTAEASAEPAATEDASVAPVPTKVTVVNKLDASVAKVDAGAKDAGTTTPANSAADYKSIMACCGALANEAKKPGLKQNQYKSAAGVCSGIAQRVKNGQANAGAARTLIRAQLAGAPVPGSC